MGDSSVVVAGDSDDSVVDSWVNSGVGYGDGVVW